MIALLLKSDPKRPGSRGGHGYWNANTGRWNYGDPPAGTMFGFQPKVEDVTYGSNMDASMWERRGYRVLHQDKRKSPNPHQLKEIAASIDEIEGVLGPMDEIMRRAHLKFVHTGGAYPKGRSGKWGGLFFSGLNEIAFGVKSSDNSAIQSSVHEFGHFLDHEAATVERTHHSQGRPGPVEVKGRFYSESEQALVKRAIGSMNSTSKTLPNKLSATEKEKIKLELGNPNYWMEPTEVFARLFTEYFAHRIGAEGIGFHDPAYYYGHGAHWSRDKFESLLPEVEDAIRVRLRILGGEEAVDAFNGRRETKVAAAKLELEEVHDEQLRKLPANLPVKFKGQKVEIRREMSGGFSVRVNDSKITKNYKNLGLAQTVLLKYFQAPTFIPESNEPFEKMELGSALYFRVKRILGPYTSAPDSAMETRNVFMAIKRLSSGAGWEIFENGHTHDVAQSIGTLRSMISRYLPSEQSAQMSTRKLPSWLREQAIKRGFDLK